MSRVAQSLLLLASVCSARAEDWTLDQRLVIACYELQVDEVVKCLRQGANVNAKFGTYDKNVFSDGWDGGYSHLGSPDWTPLMALANSSKYPDPPKELGPIWKDREKAEKTRREVPAEQLAQRERDTMAILQVLLSHGCRLNEQDNRGDTALSASLHRFDMAMQLLRYGADPKTKRGVYIDGPGDTTPLHYAIYSKRARELMQALLDHGADPLAKDSEGRTPADWLARDPKRTFDLVITSEGPRLVDHEPEKDPLDWD